MIQKVIQEDGLKFCIGCWPPIYTWDDDFNFTSDNGLRFRLGLWTLILMEGLPLIIPETIAFNFTWYNGLESSVLGDSVGGLSIDYKLFYVLVFF